MKVMFSLSGVPFKPSNKKKEMKVEYCLINDIVAKSLTTKAVSFDVVTSERFEMMVAIIAGINVNWASVLFSILTVMVATLNRKSQGYVV
ncbi:hypothetical protein F511_43515 [Dorcoceras hygrometricum]|uniref:Uncharacterized protein n=1 Tax=Dorcoceras hygrometricum TaxID=472368 RepID=A0A2Z7A650_9LAMI|nr:hypothetical protein F511_43515 [Dorcoceras hygrometricum]